MTEQASTELPAHWFSRADDAPDEVFYAQPRLVAHIDDATMDALTAFYADFLPPRARVLDLHGNERGTVPVAMRFRFPRDAMYVILE